MNDHSKREFRYKNLRPGDLVVRDNSARLVIAVALLCQSVVEVTWLPMWGRAFGRRMYALSYVQNNRVLEKETDDIVRGDE